MTTIAVFIKETDPKVIKLSKDLIKKLSERSVNILLTKEHAEVLGKQGLAVSEPKELKKAGFVLSVGGDGTMLRSARLFSLYKVPILGINLGRRGFMTEIKIDKFFKALPRLISGDYFIDPRMMLEAVVWRKGKKITSSIALNDIVIGKNGLARIIRLEAFHNGRPVSSYAVDGLIISTPTGSTGHNLSAGGPIVDPGQSCVIMTAICSLSINNRSTVVDGGGTIKVKITSVPKGMQATATIDGQSIIPLEQDDEIFIKRAPRMTKFIRLSKYDFFSVLKDKLGWAG